MIVAENLAKAFGGVRAVDGFSFEAPRGRITGLLGPNGAGKTTTLRMLVGLLTPATGSIRMGDIDVVADPLAARAAVGVLPEHCGFYPRLTAREHIAYFGQLHGVPPEQLETRTSELCSFLQMQAFIDRRVDGFSQGQRRKVALARALVHQPNYLLLDEPTNGLDVMSTRAMRRFVRQLKEEGRSVVFCSHIMQEVSALCDHIVLMAGGKVAAQGSQGELLAQAQADNLEDAFVRLTGAEEEG